MKVLDKILKSAMIISGFLTIMQWIFITFIKHKYLVETNNAASIGIIGGADGPTSIFIATKSFGFFSTFLNLCPYIAIGSAIILLVIKIYRNRSK